MVLNNPPNPPPHPPQTPESPSSSHCYRCVFPKSPPAESVTTCRDGGILGPVVGTIGVLMAVEAIKLLLPKTDSAPTEQEKPTLLIYSAFASPPFRTIRLLGKRNTCPSCSPTATVTRASLASGSLDYRAFCGVSTSANVLREDERITAEEYSKMQSTPHILIDVREKVQFDICKLDGSVNLPYSEISRDLHGSATKVDEIVEKAARGRPVILVCRYGNDSQHALEWLQAEGGAFRRSGMRDIKGGLRAWREEVDPTFPEY